MENKTDFGDLVERRKQIIEKWKKAGLFDQPYMPPSYEKLLEQPYIPKTNIALLLSPSDNQSTDKSAVFPIVRRLLNQLEGYDIVACSSSNLPYEVDESRIMF